MEKHSLILLQNRVNNAGKHLYGLALKRKHGSNRPTIQALRLGCVWVDMNLDMDMTGTVDQKVDQSIRIFGLWCDMCVWFLAPTHLPARAQTQLHPHTPPQTSKKKKKSDRWVYWKDPLRRPKHTKALSVWRLDLEETITTEKQEREKRGHLWYLPYFLSCGIWCVMREHWVFWIIFHLINEPPHVQHSHPIFKLHPCKLPVPPSGLI